MVFVKPNYFVVFDDLKTTGPPELFDFLLHLPDRDRIKLENLTATYKGEKGSVVVRSFASTEAIVTVEPGRIPYQVFSARTPAEIPLAPAYLDVKTVKPVSEMQFLTVIVPAKVESSASELTKHTTDISGPNVRGVRVERGGNTDLVMFRSGSQTTVIQQGEWTTDAASLVVTRSGSLLEVFAVQNARTLRRGTQTLFSSTSPMSLAANIGSNEVVAVCNADTEARVSLFVGKAPGPVLIDGKELSATAVRFNASDGTLSLNVPSGQHELKISLK
jgi:hypothetical protein